MKAPALKKGALRLSFEGGYLVVYASANGVEVELGRFTWRDVLAEARRFVKRIRKARKKS